MYRPSYSVHQNPELALQLIHDFPLGLLISTDDEGLETNYLPFLAQRVGAEFILITHMARSNPHWKKLSGEVLVSFQGPNRYISPTLYIGKNNVPTWNYAAVQIRGRVDIIEGGDEIREILHQSVTHFETRNGTSWRYVLPFSQRKHLEAAIVGVKITGLGEAKWKLSQNRTDEDYEAVQQGLAQSPRPSDHELLEWMRRTR